MITIIAWIIGVVVILAMLVAGGMLWLGHAIVRSVDETPHWWDEDEPPHALTPAERPLADAPHGH